MKTKFIFVTGGVVSSLGKGIMASSVGQILKNRGLKVYMLKFDPYINVDPGTMSPYQHGEVFVTDDGAETDLDLGHYERFLDVNLSKEASVSTGKIYSKVIEDERKGKFLGATIQVIPHITNEIKKRLIAAAKISKADVVITEIGGTVGDIESLPFLEAIRQARRDFGFNNTLYIHTTLVPYLKAAKEIKTKPTQHSVKELRSLGITPDMIVLRSEVAISSNIKEKIALFCDIKKEKVFQSVDVDIVYKMILEFKKQNIDEQIIRHFKIASKTNKADLTEWEELIEKISTPKSSVKVAVIGKYTSLKDAYLSVSEALNHASYQLETKIEIVYLDSEKINPSNSYKMLSKFAGILIPGGFGRRGINGKILAIKYARENNIPLLGICLGMQLSLIEFARNVVGLKDATSSEFHPHTKYAVIDLIKGKEGEKLLKPERLGLASFTLKPKTLAYRLYRKKHVQERHRHRYEFNLDYQELFTDHGLVFSGLNDFNRGAEIIEYPQNDFYISVQFHPEFISRPLRPHPLFSGFLKAALNYQKKLAL
ncbi:MAG: CTP synthase [Acholeplasmataceae bacterium]|jgi:CTP synthase|nr:CTP synthase [Acholeplasmataceae bacterium]MCK9289870.1 CTP synthase [Acholeplasmataceae bacterium]MCK9427427.1 CTP synthase [Acholeplasmataceae bacterium]